MASLLDLITRAKLDALRQEPEPEPKIYRPTNRDKARARRLVQARRDVERLEAHFDQRNLSVDTASAAVKYSYQEEQRIKRAFRLRRIERETRVKQLRNTARLRLFDLPTPDQRQRYLKQIKKAIEEI